MCACESYRRHLDTVEFYFHNKTSFKKGISEREHQKNYSLSTTQDTMFCHEEKNTFLIYSLFTSSEGILPSGEKIEAFQRAPLATMTDEAPDKNHYHLEIVCINKFYNSTKHQCMYRPNMGRKIPKWKSKMFKISLKYIAMTHTCKYLAWRMGRHYMLSLSPLFL
jgi:DNA-binding transcriptional regulator WhiA